MGDLVFLRDLIRNPEARGHSTDIDEVPRQSAFGNICECAVAWPAYPGSAVAIARPLLLCGAKSLNARTRTSPYVDGFARRCARWPNAPLLRDVAPRISPSALDMGLDYSLSATSSFRLHVPGRGCPAERVARPSKHARLGIYGRHSSAPAANSSKRSTQSK